MSWSRVFLEKLKFSQLIKKLPSFYGTQKFVTMFKGLLLLPVVREMKPHHTHPSTAFPLQYYLPIYACVFQEVYSLQVFGSITF
jgi:hypothetical protein